MPSRIRFLVNKSPTTMKNALQFFNSSTVRIERISDRGYVADKLRKVGHESCPENINVIAFTKRPDHLDNVETDEQYKGAKIIAELFSTKGPETFINIHPVEQFKIRDLYMYAGIELYNQLMGDPDSFSVSTILGAMAKTYDYPVKEAYDQFRKSINVQEWCCVTIAPEIVRTYEYEEVVDFLQGVSVWEQHY